MALCENISKAISANDADAYLANDADDAVFVRHRASATIRKPEFSEIKGAMMAAGPTKLGTRRCFYENDDILVVHAVKDKPDCARAAVLVALSVADRKIRRVETGASLLEA